ncbi:MAG TPA: hypothetical protein VFH80_23655, partial [Solirubrobacteraceae bacterium]|nr:hypothetical protein [Solirubrobacteraceae bacterium]
VTRYHLRYTPGTDLARRFGATITTRGFDSREEAERVREACPNGASMDVVEVENPQRGKGIRRADGGAAWDNGATTKDGPGGAGNTVAPGPRRSNEEID